MARILGFQYGEMRGKLGGNVFSRNKAGAYVRAKVTPVNPQTVRQQTARYRFGNMSILYQSLSSAAKDCWQVFASTHFNPLKGNNTGIYTGGNAFVALRQSAGQGNQYTGSITGTQGADVYAFTNVPYEEAIEPPLTPTSATIVCSDSVAREFQINNISMNSDGVVAYQIAFPTGSVSPTTTYNAFANAEGENFGIGFYISNNLKFPGSKPNTALKLVVSDTQPITVIDLDPSTGAPEIGSTLDMVQSNTLVKADTRDFPCEGDHVLITPFIRSQKGAQKLMAPQYITVSAGA